MAKASISKKTTLSANGILVIEDGVVGIENIDTGAYVKLQTLLSDFADKSVKITVNYDEEYFTEDE